MKRVMLIIMSVMLLSCGIFRANRSPAIETNITAKAVEAEANEESEVVLKHVSAFSAEDLYRLRSEKLRNRRRRTLHPQTEQIIEEVASEPVSEKTITEIIQIIDENGNVVASKEVK